MRPGKTTSRLLTATLLFLIGCAPATSTVFLLPPASVNNINCIAVLPLKNDTPNQNAGNVISDVLSIDLMKYGGFSVMGRMEVERVLKERGIYTPDGISPDNAQGVGIILGVQAVFTGEVKEYFYQPSSIATEGAVPTARVNISLIDTATGQVIWTGKGTFMPTGLLAAGTTPMTEVIQEGVSSLLDEFYNGIGQRPEASSRVCWYDPNTLFARVLVARRPAPQPQPQPQPMREERYQAPARRTASVRQPEVRRAAEVPPAKVSVLNASGNARESLAVGTSLIRNKINVVNVGNERTVQPKSIVYYKPDYYDQAVRIAGLLKTTPRMVRSGAYQWDITLVIGRDTQPRAAAHAAPRREIRTPAKVSLLNASGNARASQLVGVTLIKNKINVINVSMEKGVKPRTIVYYRPGYHDQALHIAHLLKRMPRLMQSETYHWDITVMIGRDLR